MNEWSNYVRRSRRLSCSDGVSEAQKETSKKIMMMSRRKRRWRPLLLLPFLFGGLCLCRADDQANSGVHPVQGELRTKTFCAFHIKVLMKGAKKLSLLLQSFFPLLFFFCRSFWWKTFEEALSPSFSSMDRANLLLPTYVPSKAEADWLTDGPAGKSDPVMNK